MEPEENNGDTGCGTVEPGKNNGDTGHGTVEPEKNNGDTGRGTMEPGKNNRNIGHMNLKPIIFKCIIALVAVLAAVEMKATVTFNGPVWYDYRDTGFDVRGKGTMQNPIAISTAEELAQVAWLVNEEGESFENKILILADDIDLEKTVGGTRVQWVPIGFKNPFRGQFYGADTRDGQSRERHHVRGMVIHVHMTSATDVRDFGLFGRCGGQIGYVDVEGSITVVSDGYPMWYKGTAYAGLLCGRMEGDIAYVSVEGDVTIGCSDASNAGGICGYLVIGEVAHSTAKAMLRSTCGAIGMGGISGSMGVEGDFPNAVIDCAADVDLTCTENKVSFTGGVVGYAQHHAVIAGCSATGKMYGYVGQRAGGIAGMALYDSRTVGCVSTVTMCDIPSAQCIGGIMGELGGHGGSANTTVEGCMYAGFIDGANAYQVGGIVGRHVIEDNEHIMYCVSLATMKKPRRADASCGAIVGYSPKPIETVVGCYYDRQLFSGNAAGSEKQVLTIYGLTNRELTSGQLRDVTFLPTEEDADYGYVLRDGFYPMVFCHYKATGHNLMRDYGLDAYVDENRYYRPTAWVASVPVAVKYGDCLDDFVSTVTLKDVSGSWTAAGLDVRIATDCLLPDDDCIEVTDMTARAVAAGECRLTIEGHLDTHAPIDERPEPLDASREVWVKASVGQVWDGTTVAPPDFGDGTAEDPFIIKRADQLAYVVNNNKAGEFYEQLCDITLNADVIGRDEIGIGLKDMKQWVVAGDWNASYDGCGHLISGAYLVGTNRHEASLFGHVTAHGSITRVGLVASKMNGLAGGLAYDMDGRLTNCLVQGIYVSLPLSGNADGRYDRGKGGGICYAVGPNNPQALVEDCISAMFGTTFLSDYSPFVNIEAPNQGMVRHCLAVVPTAYADLNFGNRESYSTLGHAFIDDCYFLKGYEASPNGQTLEEIGQGLSKRSLWTLPDARYFPTLKAFEDCPMAMLLTIPVRTDVMYSADNFLLGFNRHLTFEPGLAEWRQAYANSFIDADVDMGIIVPMMESIVIGEISGNPASRQLTGLLYLRAEYEGSVLYIPMRSSEGDVAPGITFIDDYARQACLDAFDTNGNGYLSLDELRAVTDTQTQTAFQTWTARQIVQFPEFRFFKNITTLTSQLRDMTSLQSVQLPYALKTIGEEAFRGCSRLDEVTISSKVQAVVPKAFYGSSIRQINVDPFNEKFDSRDGILFTQQKELVAYPNGRRDAEAVVEGTVKRIADGAFYKVPGLRRLYFDTTDYTTVPRISADAIVTDDGDLIDVFVSDATYDQALFTAYQRNASWATYYAAGKLHQYYPLKISADMKGYDAVGHPAWFGTFCIGFDTELPQDLTPYIVTEADRENYTASLQPKSHKIPATAAVIVLAKEPGVYRLMPYEKNIAPWPIYENRLVAVDRKGRWVNQTDAAQGSIMTLGHAADGQTMGFYPERAKSIEPYKAYLTYNTVGMDPDIAAKAHYDIVYLPPLPTITLVDGADNTAVLAQYDGQRVNVNYNRELTAVQNADGSWSSRAYTVCLPYDVQLYDSTLPQGNITYYRLVSVNDDYEFVFTNDFNYINAGIPVVAVVKQGSYNLGAEEVVIHTTPATDEPVNIVYSNYDEGIVQGGTQVGWWRGTFAGINNDEGSARHVFGLYADGKWKVIRNDTEDYRNGYIPTFRAFYEPLEHQGNWVYDSKFVLSLPGDGLGTNVGDFPSDTYQGDLPDSYGNTSTVQPVIHIIDRDGTSQYFDLQGRLLDGPPARGTYIHNGKKYSK